jgi:hypothetical protein
MQELQQYKRIIEDNDKENNTLKSKMQKLLG